MSRPYALPFLLGLCLAGTANTADLKLNDPAAVPLDEPATLAAPKGSKGWYWHGLVQKNDSAWDLRDVYAVRFEARNIGATPFEGSATLHVAEYEGRRDRFDRTNATFRLPVSAEWQSMELPISSFDFACGENYTLKFIGRLSFTAKNGKAEIRNVRFVEAPFVKLSAPIRSKAAENGVAEYPFTVKNTTGRKQAFRLTLPRRGWEGMSAKLSQDTLELVPGETAAVTLTVEVPTRLPAGANEITRVEVSPVAPGAVPESLEFITVQRVPSPFLMRDEAGWKEIAANVEKYEWAKKEFARAKALADGWTPPAKSGVMSDQGTMGVVRTRYEEKLRSCLILYKLTGEEQYLKKIRDFLLMFSNPKDGYPVLLHATSQGQPQEGGTFELVANSYDIIRDKLTPSEREQVEHTMRLFIDTVIDRMGDGAITNWTIFNQVPAAGCALILHDLARFNTLVYAPTGLIDQFVCGTMSDGWWFEMSVTYNLHCAQCFTKLGLMAKPFGIDLLNAQFPIALSDLSGRRPYELENYQGMAFTKYGPITRNSLGFKAMWDGVLDYPDYRGIMIGMGDGHEFSVGGDVFELAYYAYRDPRYAAILKRNSTRDLVYAVAELPEETPPLYRNSAHSDNAGIALLRSQSGSDRDQIQLGFKYGTHGGFHGHFDRLSLLSLMRYGRGFWNPESTWYGYPSFMYKFWVQPSLAHNMVVVDGKMQEPSECRPQLFHTGKYLQAVAADGSARWSNPPFLGGYDKVKEIKEGTERFVPIPENHPPFTETTDYTEPVFARRLQLVTDDYVLVADYLKSDKEHTFDNLLHLRGAKPIEGVKKTGHREQFDSSPLSSGQFVVNIDEYDMAAPAKLTSCHHFNPKKADGRNRRGGLELTDDYYHEPGELFVEVRQLWPRKAQLLIGDYPESQSIAKRLNYRILGDGKELASGMFHAWILGRGDIDVDIAGVKTLTLETRKDQFKRGTADTLFWGNAVLKTADGKTIPLSSLKPAAVNLKAQPESGNDYYGGPVRLAGMVCSDTLAAEPKDDKKHATLTFDLTGLNAVRLTASVGGDFPAGQEENLRKVTSVRTVGKEAKFLTVLEPHEGIPRVKSARALDENTVEVTLVDGTVDRLKIKNFYNTQSKPSVELRRNGKLLEKTECGDRRPACPRPGKTVCFRHRTLPESTRDGYAAAVDKRCFEKLRRGEIHASSFALNDVWVPLYNLHKMLAGLRDADQLCGITAAREIAHRQAHYLMDVWRNLNDDQLQEILKCEHGGIAETLINLAETTGDRECLDFACRAFCQKSALDPLRAGRDKLDGMHGNTMIPKVIGLAELYDAAGDENARHAAEFFFNRVVNFRSFANGGNGESEHFFTIGTEKDHLTAFTTESCNSYNMVKLAEHIFEWKPQSKVMDFVERTLSNHIVANIGRQPGEFGYFLSMAPVAVKVFSTPEDSFWCCVGTGMESPMRYGRTFYAHSDNTLWINHYFSSELCWTEQGLKMTATGGFPESERVTFDLELASPRKFAVKLRRPGWAPGMQVALNGAQFPAHCGDDGYLIIERTWHDGDRLEVSLPMAFRSEPLPGTDRLAFFHGPTLLAGVLPPATGEDADQDPARERFSDHLKARGKTDEFPPHLIADTTIEDPHDAEVTPVMKLDWMPLYRVYEEHYGVYFRVMSHKQWHDCEAELHRLAEYEKMVQHSTIDEVTPGFQQSEVEHALQESGSDTGDFQHRKFRRALPGGEFSYEIACDPVCPVELELLYWGAEWSSTRIALLLDGIPVAEQQTHTLLPGEWKAIAYSLPSALTTGKSTLRAGIRHLEGGDGGRVFHLRIIRKPTN